MAKSELKDQLQNYESYINDIPLVIDPCKMCKNHSKEKGFEAECAICCWFYDSKFELENIENNNRDCETCKYCGNILKNKEPCRICDNGSYWHKVDRR